MIQLADPHPFTMEQKCIRLAERSLEAGRFSLPAGPGTIVVLTADVVESEPVLRETATTPIAAAATVSGMSASELGEQLHEDRGLLVVLVLHGPRAGQQRAISIALHRPWNAGQQHSA